MSTLAKINGALVGLTVSLALVAGAALAADPTDTGFGTNGIAEIEAREHGGEEQVGGIVDLQRARGGKLLAAVYPIARGGHFFAAARINPNGSLDSSFGEAGFTPRLRFGRAHEENGEGVLQAEAVAQQKNGDVVLAGYFDDEGAFAPALARFSARGNLDRSFGSKGKVVPRPSNDGKILREGEPGGERLHDVAIDTDGDIVGVGDVVPGPKDEYRSPKQPAALAVAYRPDGRIDRSFGHDGHFEIRVPERNAYTGFTEVRALPSGKLLVSGYIRQQIVLYRLTAKGRPDPSFGRNGRVTVGRATSSFRYGFIRAPFVVGPGGRIVLCGATFPGGSADAEQPVALVRLRPDGRRDRSFDRGSIYMQRAPADDEEPSRRRHVQFFSFQPEALAIDAHGRILAVGSETAPYMRGQKEAGYQYFAARRFLPDGHRDRSFGHSGVWATNPPGSQSMARAAVTQPDGKVVAGGWIQIERGGGNGPGNTAMLLTGYR